MKLHNAFDPFSQQAELKQKYAYLNRQVSRQKLIVTFIYVLV